jgi:hypothetical protein
LKRAFFAGRCRPCARWRRHIDRDCVGKKRRHVSAADPWGGADALRLLRLLPGRDRHAGCDCRSAWIVGHVAPMACARQQGRGIGSTSSSSSGLGVVSPALCRSIETSPISLGLYRPAIYDLGVPGAAVRPGAHGGPARNVSSYSRRALDVFFKG